MHNFVVAFIYIFRHEESIEQDLPANNTNSNKYPPPPQDSSGKGSSKVKRLDLSALSKSHVPEEEEECEECEEETGDVEQSPEKQQGEQTKERTVTLKKGMWGHFEGCYFSHFIHL